MFRWIHKKRRKSSITLKITPPPPHTHTHHYLPVTYIFTYPTPQRTHKTKYAAKKSIIHANVGDNIILPPSHVTLTKTFPLSLSLSLSLSKALSLSRKPPMRKQQETRKFHGFTEIYIDRQIMTVFAVMRESLINTLFLLSPDHCFIDRLDLGFIYFP